jgi:hypothetical protein
MSYHSVSTRHWTSLQADLSKEPIFSEIHPRMDSVAEL